MTAIRTILPTMTTTESLSIRVRLSVRRVALVAIASVALLAAVGCSLEEAEPSPVNVEPGGALDVPAEGADGGEAATVPDGRALLSSALALYEDGYRFLARAEVQGLEAGTITGVVIGQSAQMTLTSGDATVSYVTTSEGS